MFGVWLRPVERTVRVREVPSSNLGTPTEKTSKFGSLLNSNEQCTGLERVTPAAPEQDYSKESAPDYFHW